MKIIISANIIDDDYSKEDIRNQILEELKVSWEHDKILSDISIDIEENQKDKIINEIKSLIKEYGSFSIADIEDQSTPLVSTCTGVIELAELFNYNNVDTSVYNNDVEIHNGVVEYEYLSTDTLCDILDLCNVWKNIKTQNQN